MTQIVTRWGTQPLRNLWDDEILKGPVPVSAPVVYEDIFLDGGAGSLNEVDTDWLAATGFLDEGQPAATVLLPFTQTAGGEIHLNTVDGNNPYTSYAEYTPFVACADQWAEIVVGQVGQGDWAEYGQMGVALRSNLATKNFIMVIYGPHNESDGYVYVFDYIGGNFTYIPPNEGPAISASPCIADNILRAEAEGTTLRVYINDILLFTGTTQIITTGKAGVIAYAWYDSADDQMFINTWRAGALPYVAP